MICAQRARHLRMWLIVGPILLALLTLTIALRPAASRPIAIPTTGAPP